MNGYLGAGRESHIYYRVQKPKYVGTGPEIIQL